MLQCVRANLIIVVYAKLHYVNLCQVAPYISKMILLRVSQVGSSVKTTTWAEKLKRLVIKWQTNDLEGIKWLDRHPAGTLRYIYRKFSIKSAVRGTST